MPALFGLPDGEGSSWFGQLFIMAAYGYILYRAAVCIGNGSEKLLLVYGPGIVGGLLIPILGAVPDGAIVLVSGLGNRAEAQCQVSTGVGTLAGSTIMLLTIPWALSLFLARRDIDPILNVAASKPNGRPKCSKGFKPFKQCVTTYDNTISSAKIMVFTAISYLIVLVPAIIEKNAPNEEQIREEHYPALVGFIICALAFVGYSLFQVWDSNRNTLQEMEQTKLKFKQWKQSVGHKIAGTDTAIKMAFQKFDKDGNGTIDRQELQNGFRELGLEMDRIQVVELMNRYQHDDDDDLNTLTFDEFSDAVKTWSLPILLNKKTTGNVLKTMASKKKATQLTQKPQNVIMVDDNSDSGGGGGDKSSLLNKDKKQNTYQSVGDTGDTEEYKHEEHKHDSEKEQILADLWKELNMEMEMDEEEEEEEQFLQWTNRELISRAVCELLFGTFLCCIFSDPMVSVIGTFSTTIGISSFFVSFIVTPIASNAAEIYSSLLFAKKKTKEGISMGFSALHGAACMNNTFVLCIFCAVVFFRQLQWTFIAETLVILLTIIIVGINGMRQTVIAWQGFIVISLFPLSLVLVALLDPLLDDVTKC